MSSHEDASGLIVETHIELEGTSDLPLERLLAAAQVAAREAGFVGPAGLTLVFVNDAHIQALNRDYRGVDAPTDVLAFGEKSEDERPPAAPFIAPQGMDEEDIPYLGDVIVSLPQATRQAGERGHPVESELCLLVVHGVLHLLGHDHAADDERRAMWEIQRRALRRLGCEAAAPAETV